MKIDVKHKIKYWTKTVIEFIINPRLLLCFGISWIATNGWAYIALAIGTWLKFKWLSTIAGTYLALLWFPFTPEKIITIGFAIILLRILFPNDTKTLEKLYKMKDKAKETFYQFKEKRKRKKERKHSE